HPRMRRQELPQFNPRLMAELAHGLWRIPIVDVRRALGHTALAADAPPHATTVCANEHAVRCLQTVAPPAKEVKDSPHPSFQLEVGWVKLTDATRLRTLDELIKRLEDLESRLDEFNSGSQSEASGEGTRLSAKKDDGAQNQASPSNETDGKSTAESSG